MTVSDEQRGRRGVHLPRVLNHLMLMMLAFGDLMSCFTAEILISGFDHLAAIKRAL